MPFIHSFVHSQNFKCVLSWKGVESNVVDVSTARNSVPYVMHWNYIVSAFPWMLFFKQKQKSRGKGDNEKLFIATFFRYFPLVAFPRLVFTLVVNGNSVRASRTTNISRHSQRTHIFTANNSIMSKKHLKKRRQCLRCKGNHDAHIQTTNNEWNTRQMVSMRPRQRLKKKRKEKTQVCLHNVVKNASK